MHQNIMAHQMLLHTWSEHPIWTSWTSPASWTSGGDQRWRWPCGYCNMWSIGSLLLRSGHRMLDLVGGLRGSFCSATPMPSLSFFLLLHLLGLVARSGTAMCFRHFVVGGTLFLVLLLGLPTAWNVSLHLLCVRPPRTSGISCRQNCSGNAR